MAKERIAIWDNLKGILIFFVVLGHFADLYTGQSKDLQSIYWFIYWFHMPLFIFISGLFSKKAIRNRNFKKVFEYIAIFFWMKIVLFIVESLCKGTLVTFTVFYESWIPWFMFALAAFYLITILLQNLDFKYLFCLSVLLACVAGYDDKISTFLVLSRIFVFYPFFLVGYHMKQELVLEKLNKIIWKVFAILSIITCAVIAFAKIENVYWIRPLLTGQNPYSTLGEYTPYGGIIRFIYYGVAFVLVFAWIAIAPQKKSFLSTIGSRSLYVYFSHYILIYVLIYLLKIDVWIMHMFPGIGYKWIVVASIFVTWICSMKWWGKVLDPILIIKWCVHADERCNKNI